jgi:hypothetical protein
MGEAGPRSGTGTGTGAVHRTAVSEGNGMVNSTFNDCCRVYFLLDCAATDPENVFKSPSPACPKSASGLLVNQMRYQYLAQDLMRERE